MVLNNYGLDNIVSTLRRLYSLRETYKTLITLRTSAVTVLVSKVRRTLIIPPFSFLIRCGECRDLMHEVADLDVNMYKVLEYSWIECKEIPSKIYTLLDHSPPILEGLGVKTIHLSSISEFHRVIDGGVLISCDACLDSDMLNDILLKFRLLIDLRSVKGLSKANVSGRLISNFKDHPLIYGVELSWFDGLLYDVRELRKVLLYGKTLIYVDSKQLVVELPNNSLIFGSNFSSLEYFLIRGLVYSC